VLSLNDVLNQGYSTSILPASIYGEISAALYAQQWVSDPNGIYQEVPAFHADALSLLSKDKGQQANSTNDVLDLACPESILQPCKKAIMSNELLDNSQNVMSPELVFVDVWNGAENTGWHSDHTDNIDFQFLIYFTAKPFDESTGGTLDTAKRPLNQHVMRGFDNITNIKRIYPEDGLVVMLNCINPSFIHRSLPLKDKLNRYVVCIGANFNFKNSASNITTT